MIAILPVNSRFMPIAYPMDTFKSFLWILILTLCMGILIVYLNKDQNGFD